MIAYYQGDDQRIENYKLDQLTHLIYSFLHLDGNRLAVDDAADSITIMKLTSYKSKYPDLKVYLALGGWGGCATCFDVFNTVEGRIDFAKSTREILEQYNADGIDLDWEYPGIEGLPGHIYRKEGKHNFTLLVRELRMALGDDYDISFAAGGFPEFFDHSIEWDSVMPLVDRVNLMSYDLVNGYATRAGHHTSLYSTPEQVLSMDYGVRYLDSLGVPRSKIVVGAAFYSRHFETTSSERNGLYQDARFVAALNFYEMDSLSNNGYETFWDSIAKAPYKYSQAEKTFVSYDDRQSVALKTQYALDQELKGIMFWELPCDSYEDGLLNAIYQTARKDQ
ncbi:MAG: glycoside hydrolase [Bacteroidia bacterium]|nr:glycoside hydrolase [Bacteroidia bacterium]